MKKLLNIFIVLLLVSGCTTKTNNETVKEYIVTNVLIEDDLFHILGNLTLDTKEDSIYRMVDVEGTELMLINQAITESKLVKQSLYSYNIANNQAKVIYQFSDDKNVGNCNYYNGHVVYTSNKNNEINLYIDDELIMNTYFDEYNPPVFVEIEDELLCILFEKTQQQYAVKAIYINDQNNSTETLYEQSTQNGEKYLYANSDFVSGNQTFAFGLYNEDGLKNIYYYQNGNIECLELEIPKSARIFTMLNNQIILNNGEIFDIETKKWSTREISSTELGANNVLNNELVVGKNTSSFFSYCYDDGNKINVIPLEGDSIYLSSQFIVNNEDSIFVMHTKTPSENVDGKAILYKYSFDLK